MSSIDSLFTIAGLALLTMLTRSFFLLPSRNLPLPAWLEQALRYAPLAALAAVAAPEIVMTQGVLISTFKDPRLPAVAMASAYFFWRRGILGTIVSGTVMLLIFKLGFGW